MTRPTSRVLALLELLQSGGTRTVAELAGRLDVDERTVRRYVEHLLDLEVPVESVRGRYGGYRLAAGFRMPPLMLDDDEALAVLLGLITGRRDGAPGPAGTAGETAAAKIRRVLPERLTRRLDAVLESVAHTAPAGGPATPDSEVLLPLADAVRHHRAVQLSYTDREGRRTDRTLHPYGLVVHERRWYVTGSDPARGANRTFRLDRITRVRTLPGSFAPPDGVDPARSLVQGFATAAYRYEVTLLVDASLEHLRTRLPASVAVVDEMLTSGPGLDGWRRVELRVESLDWVAPTLAALDRPFAIERPVELRDLVAALADSLAASARRRPPATDRL